MYKNRMDHATEGANSVYERHRAEILRLIPSWYSPVLHYAIPITMVVSLLIASVALLQHLRAIELLAIPITLFIGFGFEWRVHKWVLHHRTPGLKTLYVRHELQHHVVFTNESMELRSWREL